MKTTDIRELPDVEIDSEITKARAKLFKFRFHAANEEMQRAGEIRQLRRDIARMLTILRQRQLSHGQLAQVSGKESADGATEA